MNETKAAVVTPGKFKPRDHYTAIPHALLRRPSPFDDPNDFMIYLRLFTMSFGYGRNTCDMGQGELMEFTKLSRNSVRKSLERLEAQGWIQMIGDFKRSQIARKWRVYTPCEKGLTPQPTYVETPEAKTEANSSTGSQPDTVRNELCQNLIERGSNSDRVTGSNFEHHKERFKNNLKEISLSPISENLRFYFDGLRPQRKRESELRAYQELRRDFSEQEIADCLQWLQQKGLAGGESCHSPMLYLARAMSEVLAAVRAHQEKTSREQEAVVRLENEKLRQHDSELQESREWELREQEFNHAYPDRTQQEQIVRGLCSKHGFLVTAGPAARSFAIGAWIEEQSLLLEATG